MCSWGRPQALRRKESEERAAAEQLLAAHAALSYTQRFPGMPSAALPSDGAAALPPLGPVSDRAFELLRAMQVRRTVRWTGVGL